MNSSLQEHYDAIWAQAQAAFAANSPSLDPQLANKAADRRRSATLLIRPGPAVAANVAQVLERLRELEPQQYYYQPEELHVTVLSLWTGTDQPEPYFAQLPAYRQAISAALDGAPAMTIRFDGVTASPAAVLVQGFPDGPELNNLRDRLRDAITAAGLGHTLDGRYRISAAHMTAVRFYRPLQNLPRLTAALQALRRCNFGVTQVGEIQLVENDWYMSHDRVRVLQTYPLE
jgi:2'-5' RNA ligase